MFGFKNRACFANHMYGVSESEQRLDSDRPAEGGEFAYDGDRERGRLPKRP